ncbi:unnamed protein product [Phytophthora lilii]|uniref:Unnamed protein product n=1 Tax=Phytophthora lilii TaxID=2077276 RepID=A0A9W6X807_9STRA|nr:unnamed protein product [Phytophthora lilii]
MAGSAFKNFRVLQGQLGHNGGHRLDRVGGFQHALVVAHVCGHISGVGGHDRDVALAQVQRERAGDHGECGLGSGVAVLSAEHLGVFVVVTGETAENGRDLQDKSGANLKLAAKPESPALFLQISSILGSLASNNDEYAQMFRGQYGYSTSKAALTMITRSLALDLRESNVAVMTTNPGYVATDMSNHQGVLKPADTVEAMATIVSKLSLKDTGKFLNADPAIPSLELPW